MLVDGFTLTNPVQTGIKRDVSIIVGDSLTVNEDSIGWKAHAKVTFDRIFISLAVPATGSSIKFFLKKNGEKLTDVPTEIPAGTDFLEMDLSDLSSTTAEVGDYFNIEILQVGSTVSGSNLTVQINQYVSSAMADVYDLDMEYYAQLVVTNQISRFITTSSYDVEYVGFYEDWIDQTGHTDIGSISGVVRDGFILKGLYAYHNFTDNSYKLVLRVSGAGIAQDFIRSIYVEGLGHFLTSDTESYALQQLNNMTQWRWTITDDMFNVIKNATTTGVRISRTTELDYTDPYVIPARYTVVLRDRLGFRTTQVNTGINNYSINDNVKGLLLNGSLLPSEILLAEFQSATDNSTLGAATDYFRIFVPGNVSAANEIGCVKFPGFGNFAMSSRASRTYAANDVTVYVWTVKKEQSFNAPKTALDFGIRRKIEIDTSKPAYNRSYTAGTLTVSTKIYKGWRSGGSGSSGTVLGSISSTDVSGKTLCEFMFLSDTNYVTRYFLVIRFTQNNLTVNSFGYVDVDLLGRFYASESWVNQHDTYTQFAWPISLDKFNAAPTATPHKMFYLA